jgi:hypothetical protein
MRTAILLCLSLAAPPALSLVEASEKRVRVDVQFQTSGRDEAPRARSC